MQKANKTKPLYKTINMHHQCNNTIEDFNQLAEKRQGIRGFIDNFTALCALAGVHDDDLPDELLDEATAWAETVISELTPWPLIETAYFDASHAGSEMPETWGELADYFERKKAAVCLYPADMTEHDPRRRMMEHLHKGHRNHATCLDAAAKFLKSRLGLAEKGDHARVIGLGPVHVPPWVSGHAVAVGWSRLDRTDPLNKYLEGLLVWRVHIIMVRAFELLGTFLLAGQVPEGGFAINRHACHEARADMSKEQLIDLLFADDVGGAFMVSDYLCPNWLAADASDEPSGQWLPLWPVGGSDLRVRCIKRKSKSWLLQATWEIRVLSQLMAAVEHLHPGAMKYAPKMADLRFDNGNWGCLVQTEEHSWSTRSIVAWNKLYQFWHQPLSHLLRHIDGTDAKFVRAYHKACQVVARIDGSDLVDAAEGWQSDAGKSSADADNSCGDGFHTQWQADKVRRAALAAKQEISAALARFMDNSGLGDALGRLGQKGLLDLEQKQWLEAFAAHGIELS